MTDKEYLKALEQLGLSNRSAARFLGVDERTTRRWLEGTPIPELVAILLRYMVRAKRKPHHIRPDWEVAA